MVSIRKKIIIFIIIVFMFLTNFIGGILVEISVINSIMQRWFQPYIEYADDFPESVERMPLRKIGDDTSDDYKLVWYNHTMDIYLEIDDDEFLREHKNDFVMTVRRSLYFTTNEGGLTLYKNGERIDSVPYEGYIPYKPIADKFEEIKNNKNK